MLIAADRGVKDDPKTGEEPISVDKGLAGPMLGPPQIILGLVMI